MPITAAREISRTTSRRLKESLREASREVRGDWTHEERLERVRRAEQMQESLWSVVHGGRLARATVSHR